MLRSSSSPSSPVSTCTGCRFTRGSNTAVESASSTCSGSFGRAGELMFRSNATTTSKRSAARQLLSEGENRNHLHRHARQPCFFGLGVGRPRHSLVHAKAEYGTKLLNRSSLVSPQWPEVHTITIVIQNTQPWFPCALRIADKKDPMFLYKATPTGAIAMRKFQNARGFRFVRVDMCECNTKRDGASHRRESRLQL